MERVLTRLLTKKVPYTFNRAGYYYFSRRVPADLLSHYSYPRIVQGLKTRSAQTAKSRALVAAAKLDEYWSHLSMTDPDLIGRSLLKSGHGSFPQNSQIRVSTGSEQPITLSEALETYLTQKGASKPKTFKAAAQRACSYLVDACGAKTLAEYTRADALSYRDYLIAKGLVGSSVSRVISSIRAIFNFAISEYALDLKNPFVGMYFDKSAGVSKRLPIPIDDIIKGQKNESISVDYDLKTNSIPIFHSAHKLKTKRESIRNLEKLAMSDASENLMASLYERSSMESNPLLELRPSVLRVLRGQIGDRAGREASLSCFRCLSQILS